MTTRGPYRRRYREPGWLPLLETILTGTTRLPDAACTELPDAFAAAEIGEPAVDVDYRHRTAVNICHTCPALAACRQWATTQPHTGMVLAAQRPPLPRSGRRKAG